MIEHQPQARIALGHLVGEMHVLVMEQHHRRDAMLLQLAPHPVEAAVEQRLAQHLGVEGEAHAQHALLLLPARQGLASAGCVGIEAAHDAEAVGMAARGLDGEIVAIALPRRRHDDDSVDAGLVHLGQEFFLAERRAVRLGARRPRAFRRVGAPDMDLCVDDFH